MANRIQHKRSSIEGRRPDGSYMEPGEIALNTNAADPGLFFEGNDGSILKAGPAHVGKVQPYTEVGFGNGETWFNSATNSTHFWSAQADKWLQNISVPFGGSTHVVYVGSQYAEASDDVSNDGRSRPFATINRAVLEITKMSILTAQSDEIINNRYVIFVLPGLNVVYNEPGVSSLDFAASELPLEGTATVTPSQLRKFNPLQGGLILPRGCSLIGLDPSKTYIRPTCYPYWKRADFEVSPLTVGSRCNIISCTGNSTIEGLTFLDKNDQVTVTDISGGLNEPAIFKSFVPHGFKSLVVNSEGNEEFPWYLSADFATLTYPEDLFLNNEGTDSTSEGLYVIEPISATEFYLRRGQDGVYILRRQLPNAPVANTSPALWCNLTVSLGTHHRLSSVGYTNSTDLLELYSKTQYAWRELNFGGASENAQVLASEVTIRTELPDAPVSVNRVKNGPARLLNCRVLSEYGMNGIRIDGDSVEGLKSAEVIDTYFGLFQNDPDVYEVYYDNQWIPLKEATWRGTKISEDRVTNNLALAYLINSVMSENLRFYYTHDGDSPEPGSDTSSGLPLDTSDTRHSAIQSLNSSSIDVDGVSVLGAAVAFWSRSGSDIKIRDSEVQYGIQSLRSEGFKGINTLGGADSVHTGFEVQGIRLPLTLTRGDLENEANRVKKYLNVSVSYVSERSLSFLEPIDLSVIHPYTLKAGDAIWIERPDGNHYSAILADPPVSSDLKTINLNSTDNDIFVNAAQPEQLVKPPYIRRFVDPRSDVHRDWALWVKNTDTRHQAPVPGSILRLSEDNGSTIVPLLDPGNQLDPGANGGWNHCLKVSDCFTKQFGDNPNSKTNPNQTTTSNVGYYLTLNPFDSFGPWDETKKYGAGSYASLENKTYKTTIGQPNPSTLKPRSTQSVWSHSSFYEHLIPVGESFNNSDDTYIPGYTADATYVRGIAYGSASVEDANPIDTDDGSSTFGLLDPSNTNLADPLKTTPTCIPSYVALRRLLELLGYENLVLDSLLTTANWSERNVLVPSFGPLDVTCGYAASTGNWPVEFNRPSTIWCESVLWEAPGHLNYSKGLPQYRKSQLSRQLQRDCEISEVWGGRVVATGQSADGDLINYRTTNI